MDACDRHRRTLSASADGEADARSSAALRAHLARCAACTAYASELVELDRLVQHALTTDAPDLTDRVLAALGPATTVRRVDRTQRLRAFVALIGVVQLLLAVPVLAGLSTHLARDLAVFEFALAGALLYAAVRPGASQGLLPFAGLLAIGGVATVLADVSGGASMATELGHLLPAAAVAPLWQLSRGAPPTRRFGGRVAA